MRLFISITGIVIIVAMFSTQNLQPVTVSVIAWQFHASLACIIIGFAASFHAKLSRKRREGEHPDIEIKNGKAP